MAITNLIRIIAKDDATKTFDKVDRKVNRSSGSFQNFGRVFGVVAGATGAGLLTKSIFDLGIKFQSLEIALASATGSVQGGAQAMGFARKTAEDLGLDLFQTAEQYSKLAAAAKGTELEGEQTRKIFTSVAQAARVLNLSTDDAAGAFRAIQQVISKGTLQAEEIRGQFGERIPGAFQIASRAVGVTTQELGKMLEQGQVVATDFLPKFAAELDKTFGEQAESAKNSPAAKIQRLKNAMLDLQIAIAQSGFIDFLADTADGFTAITEAAGAAVMSVKGLLAQDLERLYTQSGGVANDLDRLTKRFTSLNQVMSSVNGDQRLEIQKQISNVADEIIEKQLLLYKIEQKIARLETPVGSPVKEDKDKLKSNNLGFTDDALAKQLEKIESSLATENERVKAAYARRQEIVAGSIGVINGITEQKAAELRGKLNTAEQEDLDALLAKEEAKKQRLMDSFLSREELALIEIERKKERAEMEITDKQTLDDVLIDLERQKQDKILNLVKSGEAKKAQIEKLSGKAKMNIAGGLLKGALGQLASHNKKAFQANKALGVADALISTYQGIAAGVKLGWPLAIPAVAYAAATGFAQVNAIKSQSYGGGGGASTVGSVGGAAITSLPAAQTIPEQSQQGLSRSLNLIVTGDFIDSRDFAEKVNSSLTELYGDNAPLAVSVGA